MPKCDACGRYARREPGSSWARRYGGWPPQPWTAGVIGETPDAG